MSTKKYRFPLFADLKTKRKHQFNSKIEYELDRRINRWVARFTWIFKIKKPAF